MSNFDVFTNVGDLNQASTPGSSPTFTNLTLTGTLTLPAQAQYTVFAGAGTTGLIATLGSVTGGTLYTTGTYTGVSLTGGTGSGAKATVVVAGGAVTTVTITTVGTGYTVNDSLSASAANIGGTGSGFSVPVATINAVPVFRALVAGDIPPVTNMAGGAAGSLNYQTAANTSSQLAIGTAGQILVTNAGATAPAWSSTLSANYSFSGTPTFSNPIALGSSTATTQSTISNDTKVATDAYVDRSFYLPTAVGFREDFLHSSASGNVTTATGMFFDTNWSATVVVGGTSTQAMVDSTWANPGQLLLTTPATSGDGIALYKGNGFGCLGNLAAQGGWDIHIICKLGQTATTCIRLGVAGTGQKAADGPTSGIYVEYDTANTGNTDTDFTWVTRSASGANVTYGTTNAIAADTNFHHFRIRSLVAGTVLFSVDGGTEYSTSSNVPTTLQFPFVQLIARTSGAKTLTMDWFSYGSSTTRT